MITVGIKILANILDNKNLIFSKYFEKKNQKQDNLKKELYP